jgi:hypothetical protein
MGIKTVFRRFLSLFSLASWRAAGPKIAILMMQKDEDQLLEFWFAYHADHLGAENLFVFDNGSTHPSVLNVLERISAAGGNVIWEHNDHDSFCNKGLVFLDHMRTLRKKGYEVFIPLDCDEFIAIETDGGPSIDWRLILEEIARSAVSQTLRTSHCYLNNPFRPGMFKRSPFRKVFGTFEEIDWLGEGFHHVRAPMEPTKIAYIHFHRRPFEDLRDKAAAKLVAHGQDLTEENLKRFAESTANNHQAAKVLLMKEEEYEAQFDDPDYREHNALCDWFAEHVGRLPFDARTDQG